MKILKCKITDKVFYDIENRSGTITEHLKSLSINVESSYKRRKYLKENNIHWHFQFFNLLNIEEKDKFKCKYCDWETIDLENKSGCYTSHLESEHKKSINKYLLEFPEESYKFKTFVNNSKKNIETLKEGNFVICKICGEKMRYITNTHLKKHNITPEEYKQKYPNEDYASKNFIYKTKKNLIKASKNIKKSFVSKPEKDLKNFIENDLNLKILNNDKKIFNGIEIDIIIPNKKICIEFNGNLYHSEIYGKKNKNFHLNKTEMCFKKGYKLIHVFEDEWFLKNDIVKEKLKHILNIGEKKSIYARKCIIKEISSKEKNIFLNKNHIQGEDNSEIKLGAFFNNKLISVITLSENRNMNSGKKHNHYEIKRFASDINFNVVGVFSKFISFIKNNYNIENLFTFLDLRWNFNKIDNVYHKNGFKLTKILKPEYTYYNSKISRYKRFHKFNFGKNSIKRKYPEIYDENKTEWEMMQELGYDRIWDCGKYKYELNIKNAEV
jgi:DNA-dependent RNA polymerase auxiliary subunit epsilon